MSKGREFQIVGAATEKLLELKHVRTRGTDNRLVSDDLELDALVGRVVDRNDHLAPQPYSMDAA